MRRDEWIKANLDQLGAKYRINLTGFEVRSIFVTQQDMLFPHLKKMSLPIPFLSSYDLTSKGFQAVKNAGK
ncbi:hypothetical protein [Pedobacter frigidisoli]|uniref:hypothetical protein n=1 Tax=Pedobacter frigidisoli TaxID=2530455 RepID=UPI00292CE1FE|nr:hypothetical protein [Pedobacter frigidisoli]